MTITAAVRAALYARVSGDKQVENDTIASQVEALQARIRADGLRVEAEACGSRKPRRPVGSTQKGPLSASPIERVTIVL